MPSVTTSRTGCTASHGWACRKRGTKAVPVVNSSHRRISNRQHLGGAGSGDFRKVVLANGTPAHLSSLCDGVFQPRSHQGDVFLKTIHGNRQHDGSQRYPEGVPAMGPCSGRVGSGAGWELKAIAGIFGACLTLHGAAMPAHAVDTFSVPSERYASDGFLSGFCSLIIHGVLPGGRALQRAITGPVHSRV
jgi:hypothetical protein